MRKFPDMMTNQLHKTIMSHLASRLRFSGLQLSWSHMKPIGWNDISVPKSAPMNETRPPKMGMALAMM